MHRKTSTGVLFPKARLLSSGSPCSFTWYLKILLLEVYNTLSWSNQSIMFLCVFVPDGHQGLHASCRKDLFQVVPPHPLLQNSHLTYLERTDLSPSETGVTLRNPPGVASSFVMAIKVWKYYRQWTNSAFFLRVSATSLTKWFLFSLTLRDQ